MVICRMRIEKSMQMKPPTIKKTKFPIIICPITSTYDDESLRSPSENMITDTIIYLN